MLNCLCFPLSDLLSCSLPTNHFCWGHFWHYKSLRSNQIASAGKHSVIGSFLHSITNSESPFLSPFPKLHKSGRETSNRYGTVESGSLLRTGHSCLRCLVRGYNFSGYSYANAMGTNLTTLRLAYKSYFRAVCKPPFFQFQGYYIFQRDFCTSQTYILSVKMYKW